MRDISWDALRGALAGELLRPGNPEYEAIRRPVIANFRNVRPQAIAVCATADDVAAAVSFTGEHGLPIAVRSGGHSFAGASTTNGVVIDTTPLNRIENRGQSIRVGAGTRLGQLYDRLAQAGQTLPAGCGAGVGIAGLTLGGGLGILGRTYGVTSDRLVGAQIVLADGRGIACDHTTHADLFWLLRGGGAPGVVTELKFAPVPAQPGTGFHLQWFPSSSATASKLVDGWQRWAPRAPDELAASLLVSVSGEPSRPLTASLFGASTGTYEDCLAALEDLLTAVGTAPDSTSYRSGSHLNIKRFLTQIDVHALGGEEPRGFEYCKSSFFAGELPRDAIAALLDLLPRERAPGEVRELDFTPWAGSYVRAPADATAFCHREARFLLKLGLTVPPAQQRSGRSWLRRSWDITHEWGTGGCYQNFPDPDLPDPARSYYGPNASRVREIRQRYDPARRFDPERGPDAAPRPWRLTYLGLSPQAWVM